MPPSQYYCPDFFDTLRALNLKLDLTTATVKQLYSALLESVLYTPAIGNSPTLLKPVRVESLHTTINWGDTWRMARIPGLPSDISSFGFRLHHDLLSTQERVARLGGNRGSRAPGMCRRCVDDIAETQQHVFQLCPSSHAASTALLTVICTLEPTMTHQDMLFLQLPVEASLELPMVTTILAGLKYLWDARLEGKVANPDSLRSELEARRYILLRTKHQAAAQVMSNMLLNYPPA